LVVTQAARTAERWKRLGKLSPSASAGSAELLAMGIHNFNEICGVVAALKAVSAPLVRLTTTPARTARCPPAVHARCPWDNAGTRNFK